MKSLLNVGSYTPNTKTNAPSTSCKKIREEEAEASLPHSPLMIRLVYYC